MAEAGLLAPPVEPGSPRRSPSDSLRLLLGATDAEDSFCDGTPFYTYRPPAIFDSLFLPAAIANAASQSSQSISSSQTDTLAEAAIRILEWLERQTPPPSTPDDEMLSSSDHLSSSDSSSVCDSDCTISTEDPTPNSVEPPPSSGESRLELPFLNT